MNKKLTTIYSLYSIIVVGSIAYGGMFCGGFDNASYVEGIFVEVEPGNEPLATNIYQSDSASIHVIFESATFKVSNESLPSSFSLINGAYACSPPVPDSHHKISSIEITASGEVNDRPSDTDLSDLLVITQIFSDDYWESDSMSMAEFLDTNPDAPNQLSLVFIEGVDIPNAVDLTIKIGVTGHSTQSFEDVGSHQLMSNP